MVSNFRLFHQHAVCKITLMATILVSKDKEQNPRVREFFFKASDTEVATSLPVTFLWRNLCHMTIALLQGRLGNVVPGQTVTSLLQLYCYARRETKF
jgi:hypothetical protein